MNEGSRLNQHGARVEAESADADWLRARLDPRYSNSHETPTPWRDTITGSGRSRPTMRTGDFAWIPELRDEQVAQFKAELQRRLCLMPSGQRIRNLRAMLGWTQRRAAEQLGISVRTVIRHEHGHHRTPWLRHPLLLRLREVESDHAEELIAHLARG